MLPFRDCRSVLDEVRALWEAKLVATGVIGEPSNEGQQCTEPIDLLGDHATECKIGPHVSPKHDNACDQLCKFVEEAGASARREVCVHELCDSIL